MHCDFFRFSRTFLEKMYRNVQLMRPLKGLLLPLLNTARHLAETRHRHEAPVMDSSNVFRKPISFHVTDLTKLIHRQLYVPLHKLC